MAKEYIGDEYNSYNSYDAHRYAEAKRQAARAAEQRVDPRRGMPSAPRKDEEDRLEDLRRELARQFALDQKARESKKSPPPPPVSDDERRANALYLVADHHFSAFIEMVKDPKTTPKCIEILKKLCIGEYALHKRILDVLNDAQRPAAKTFFDHLMEDDD